MINEKKLCNFLRFIFAFIFCFLDMIVDMMNTTENLTDVFNKTSTNDTCNKLDEIFANNLLEDIMYWVEGVVQTIMGKYEIDHI